MKRLHGAFILARYSTEHQNPDSIEVQVEKCSGWCKEHNMPILGVFADYATSGMKDTRPQYEAMMNELRMGNADTVVIYDQSRMFRKMTAWFAFRDELAPMGVTVVSVTQPLIGKDLRDPANFLTEGSMALFNQIWALQTRQKVMEKMRYMARNAQHTGGIPALGYQVIDGKLQICEEEAVIVRRIFSEYASGKSYKNIIDGLNADGIKTKRGNRFGSNSLHDLLHNEKYIGVLVYGASPYRENGTRNTHSKDGTDVVRIEDAIPAIVSKEVFYAVQERMAQNKRLQGGRPSTVREYPLRGKVFCAECKSAMTISTSKGGYHYYKCTAKKRTHECDSSPVRADYLEKRVAEVMRSVLGVPGSINKLLRIMRDQASEIQNEAVTRLKVLVERDREIATQLANAADAILSGLTSPTLLSKVRALEEERTAISAEMLRLKKDVDATAIPEARLTEILQQMTESNMDVSVILSIVYRVEVAKDSITIWTILDADPNGRIDLTQDGVTITDGTGFAVPKKNNPNLIAGFGLFLYLDKDSNN